jgi:hypothetical protein
MFPLLGVGGLLDGKAHTVLSQPLSEFDGPSGIVFHLLDEIVAPVLLEVIMAGIRVSAQEWSWLFFCGNGTILSVR